MGTAASCRNEHDDDSSSEYTEEQLPYSKTSTSHHMTGKSPYGSSCGNSEQKQMEEEVSSLKKKIAEYEEQFKLLHDVRTREELPTFDETLKLRDMQIKRINEELEKLKIENHKLRLRYKKKVRENSLQLSEVKQSSSIRIMELRQEMHKLNTENLQLKERLGLTADSMLTPRQIASEASGAASDLHPEDRNHRVIIELSNQLNQRTEELERLSTQLTEKEAYISQLEHDKLTKVDNSDKSRRRRQLRSHDEQTNVRQHSGKDSGLESDHPDSAGTRRPQRTQLTVLPEISHHAGFHHNNNNSTYTIPLESSFVSEISEDMHADTESIDSYDTLVDGQTSKLKGQNIIFDPDKQRTIEGLLQN